jgi:hypothetical protein
VRGARSLLGRIGLLGLALAIASCSSGPIEPFGAPGTRWTVDSIDNNRSEPASISMAVAEPTQSDAQASLVIQTGCRSVSLAASWDNTDGIWVSIDHAAALDMPCDGSLAGQDRDFFAALGTFEEASISGDRLTLHGDHDIRLQRVK